MCRDSVSGLLALGVSPNLYATELSFAMRPISATSTTALVWADGLQFVTALAGVRYLQNADEA
eukprot:2335938-Rhodomonas_salina.1